MFLNIFQILIVFGFSHLFKKTADIATIVGWIVTGVSAIFYFKTSFDVVLKFPVMAFLAALPVSLVVVTSILQLNVMELAGVIKRIIAFIKGLSEAEKVFEALILNESLGHYLVSC